VDNEKEKNKKADKPESKDRLEDSFDNSAIYVQDKKNYLYRDD
jgi:hypothetical protein